MPSTKFYSDPHKFIPYPTPGKQGCVRCQYPKDHAVHAQAAIERALKEKS
jgi:hypothetical protein